jgi:carbonic anhydrase
MEVNVVLFHNVGCRSLAQVNSDLRCSNNLLPQFDGMKNLRELLENNRVWSEGIKARDPEFFHALAQQQTPRYLWIGCSDSRVPATQLVALPPGELFVHRNVANVVVHTDFNCLSVLQFAVDVLKVSHIIVCGHDGCGGVQAAMRNLQLGLIDNWLRHVQDVMHSHEEILSKISDEGQRLDKLCELNVIEQVLNVSRTTIVQNAWGRGQELAVHGWIYGIGDGLLRDLDICITNQRERSAAYESAIRASD